MKRLLFVSTSTTVGGAEKTLYTLATLVDPKVCEVAGVVSLKPKGRYAYRLEKAGTPVYSLDVESRAGLGDIQRLAMVIHETKPDLVHAIMYQAIQLCRAVRKLGYGEFNLISSPRVNYRTRGGLSLLLDGFLKKNDDLLITECRASREYLVDHLDYPQDKTMTIHNGVDIAGWPISKHARAERRKMLGLDEKDILIGSVGRLDEQKGYVYLLEAMARLRTMHPAKCVLIGQGPQAERLEGMVRNLSLEGTVRLLGEQPQSDIPAWLSAMDIFVLPSLWEGLPNALLEAMALGLPVVATRVDGIPEAVLHDSSGLLCAPKDPQALCVPIGDLIIDPSLRRILGDAAKKTVAENFTLAEMIRKYETAYRSVTGEDGD